VVANIICRDLSFGYDGSQTELFNHLDLVIDTGWHTALVGRNGRGKTTLMRLLAGELALDIGQIERPVPCCMFSGRPETSGVTGWEAAKDAAGPFRLWETELEALLSTKDVDALQRFSELELTYREQGGYQLDAGLERELDSLDVGPTVRARPFAELSGGEQTRCLLAGLFARDHGFPLIDEPTNHLDLEGRHRLASYLAGKPGFLLVSHDRAFLDGCTDHVIALNPDTVEVHRLGYSAWRDAYLARLGEQARTNELLKKDIRRLEGVADARRQGAFARESDKAPHTDKGFIGSRAARQMKRALAAERRADQAAEARRDALIDMEKTYSLKLLAMPPGVAASTTLFRATNLAARRDVRLFEPVSFTVKAGERVAVLGANGSGKTTLLDLIAGGDVDYDGVLERPGHIQVSRATQVPRWQRGKLAELLVSAGLDEGRFRQFMAALGVRGVQLEQPLEQLSQGQLKKVELARSLSKPAHLLIWDEPLNYIDVETREQIEELLVNGALKSACPALIFVEHDACFIDRVATGTIRLDPPRQAARP